MSLTAFSAYLQAFRPEGDEISDRPPFDEVYDRSGS